MDSYLRLDRDLARLFSVIDEKGAGNGSHPGVRVRHAIDQPLPT